MRPRLATAPVLALLLAGGAPLRAQVQRLDSLRSAIERRIAADSGAVAGVYFKDLNGTDSLAIRADLRFHAASTMKVPVMIQVFRDADAQRFSLRDRMPVVNDFRSLADSSTFHLDRADDSDSSLYLRVGQPVAITDLLELMITRSSNLATNNLIGRVDAARVQATLHEMGADSVQVLRGVEDGPAFRAGLNNTTTARGMGQVFAAIADGAAASPQSCGQMLQILMRQSFNEGIPAGLPRHTRVAHKTGWITGQDHDAGIVYWKNRPRYVLVILTRGLTERSRSARLMADLAGMVHAYAVPEAYLRNR